MLVSVNPDSVVPPPPVCESTYALTDSSTNGFTVTESGSVVQGSFSPYGDNWANSFDGDSDALTIPDSTDFDFGTGDFTMEAWIYPRTLNDVNDYNTIASAHDPTAGTPAAGESWVFTVLNNQKLTVYGSGGITSSSNATVSLNEWSHVMITRSSGTIRFFINGTLDTNTPSVTGNFNCASYGVVIGRQANVDGSTTRYWDGWISNVRLVKGTALQTSSFTPSTSPLTAVTNTVLLACQSNRFVDNSSSSHTLTPTGTVAVTPFSPFKDSDARTLTADGGSAYFSGAKLDVGSASDFAFGTGDFTVDAWVYLNSDVTTSIFNVGGASTGSFGFYYNASTKEFELVRYGDAAGSGQSSAQSAVGQWFHLRGIRSGGTTKLFINGVEDTGASYSMGSITATNLAEVGGGAWEGTNTTNAYIADLRVEVGTATSTSNFTPPTSPVSTTANTDLLLNFQDAGIFDRAGINNIDTIGDARLGFAPIYGTGSLAFDGTGDYLGIENTPELRLNSSSPFTIELWVYANALSGDQHFFWAYDPSSPYTGWALAFGANSQAATTLTWWDGTSWTNIKTGMETNRWYHIAVCSEGSASTGRFFVDGVQQGSAYTIPSTILNTTTNIRLGGQNNTFYFNGYFDDVRITNGVARYTSDFTPPTEIDLSTDTHREYVTLFLDGDGTVNGQNNTFTDSSTNDFTVTESGSVVQGVLSPYGDNWSNDFDGSGDYLTASLTSDFNVGTNSFTVEFWAYLNATGQFHPALGLGADSSNGFLVDINSSNNVRLIAHIGGSWGVVITGGTALSANQWYHIAVVRDGNDFDIYLNGSSDATTATNTGSITNPSGGNQVSVGGYQLASTTWRYFKGYISNLRLVNGTAVYTSNFTPSTSLLTDITNTKLLMCQSNRFIDNSSSSHTFSVNGTPKVSRFSPLESDKPYDITTDGGSGYFKGSGDYLSVGGVTTEFDFGTGDLTIEGWVNLNATGQFNPIVLFGRDTHSGITCDISSSNNPRILAHIGGSWGAVVTGSTALTKDQWYHLAFVRNGSSFKIYVNGVEDASATNAGSITSVSSDGSAVKQIGYLRTSGGGDRYFNGYISTLRVVKGTAVYTSAFTPPTAPLTAVTNTELLLNFQDSEIPDLSGLNNIDTVGNAKVGGTDPTKYGSNAIQFDGTGDYLTFDHSLNEISFGTGDFTIEGWFYIQSGDEYPYALDFRNTGSQAAPALYFYNYGNGSIDYYVSGASRILGTSAGNDVWQHIAVCRSGTSTKMFVNGTQSGSTYTDSTNYSAYSGNIGIKYDNVRPFKGFIDDFRITKGYARYTTNFTPPDAALKKF
jgi:hypothetical protein